MGITKLLSNMVEVTALMSEVLSDKQFAQLQGYLKACIDAVQSAQGAKARQAIMESFVAYAQDMLDSIPR